MNSPSLFRRIPMPVYDISINDTDGIDVAITKDTVRIRK